MRKNLVWAVLSGTLAASVLAPASEGCAWWQKNESVVTQYTEADGACVLNQVFTVGAVDPLAIVAACVPVTFAQVTAIITSLVNFYLFPEAGAPLGDAGVSASGQYCGYGVPTPAGAPTCVSHDTLLRLMSLHVAAQAETK